MNNFDHFAFQVKSMDASILFYTQQLGFTLLSRDVNSEEHEEFAFLTWGNLRLELIQDLSRAPGQEQSVQPPYCPHLAIETKDMKHTVAFLKAKEVPILRGPLRTEGEATWLYFADPDNNILEYIQWLNK
jgi:lactoylglutathione lyase